MTVVGVLALALLCNVILAESIFPSAKHIDHEDYLKKFGYLDENKRSHSQGDLGNAISAFQKMFNIKQTGVMDSDTRSAMAMPRCGNSDTPINGSAAGQRRGQGSAPYVYLGSKWMHVDLSYKITKYTRQITRAGVDRAVARALKYWADVSSITFRKVGRHAKADVDIRFEKYSHGDRNPFDGPLGTLAHTFAPENGKSHFDDSETWVIKPDTRYGHINLKQVMTHEFGHLLGMDHSYVAGSVMFPAFKGYDPNFALGTDDIKGIQALYGKYGTKPADHPSDHALCDDPSFDAVTMADDYLSYGFKGSYYYRITGSGGIPMARPISDWGVPSKVDAVLGIPKQKTLFFKGNQVYLTRRKRVSRGYPKRTDSEYPGLPRNRRMDAAFYYQNHAYFLFGSDYYMARIASGSRARIVTCPFQNMPSKVTGVFHWHGYSTFVFSGRTYYTIPNGSTKVKSSSPVNQYWVKC